jgi:hypothetical protein
VCLIFELASLQLLLYLSLQLLLYLRTSSLLLGAVHNSNDKNSTKKQQEVAASWVATVIKQHTIAKCSLVRDSTTSLLCLLLPGCQQRWCCC